MNILDKEEFRIKLDEINHLVEKKDYKGAMNVVDSIDWRRVKNGRTLCVVGEIYAANKRYEDSKEIFLLAYHRSQIGKNILYRLIEVSLKMGDIDDAMEFYERFTEVAPNDNTRYILQYKIYKAKRASLSEQIQILEEYKEKEFTERWSYELAKLYYKAGDKEKCLDLCNEIILWFSEGKYVMKALDMKLRMGALTGAEKEKYEQQFVPKLITPEEARALRENAEDDLEEEKEEDSKASQEEEERVIDSISLADQRDINNAETLQEKISKGIRDIFGGFKKDNEGLDEEEEGEDLEKSEVQEEMLRDISSREEFQDVPELEPEDGKAVRTEKTEIPAEPKKPDFSATMRMPELKIPKSMKNMEIPEEKPAEPVEQPEIPAPEVPVPNMISGGPLAEQKADEFNFNLEDTILAAASAQGIEIPEGKEEPVKEEEPQPVEEEEEVLTEEDLQQAEAEFLNGPIKKEEPKAVSSKEREVPSLEPEEFLQNDFDDQENSLEENIQELEKIKQQVNEHTEEAPKKPAGMRTEVFNFQQELQKALGEQDALRKETQKKPLTQEEELEQFIESIQPKEEHDPLDIIPREKKLREEEKKLFTYFVKVPGMEQQLIDTLCDTQIAASDKTSKTGNIIVMGGRETGKTRLISGLIPAICQELNIEASKVAYVFADQINGKDIARIVGKLSGGFLVIENANQLTQETVDQLDKAMEFRTDGMTVIIEDEKIGMRKFIARNPKFAKKFTSMINIPVFTNDELVNFAKIYTKENGYTIDQMGMLALYNLIGINQKEDEPMNIGAVKEIIDNAIAKSQGGIRKLKRNISKKRTDRDGYIVLYEKDFS